MSKVLLKVNEHRINVEIKEAQELCDLFNEGVKMVSKLTDGEVKDFNMDAIDNYLNTKTGFLNAEMSALAFNLKSEYLQVKSIANEGLFNSDVITYKKGKYQVSEEPIIDAHTTYMRDRYVSDYETFKKAVELMESLPYDIKSMVERCVKRDGTVNAESFNSFCSVNSRKAR